MLTDEQRADGWIEHDGSSTPLPSIYPTSWVTVKFRGEADPAKGALRTHGMACRYIWHHDGEEDDIIAYKLENRHD